MKILLLVPSLRRSSPVVGTAALGEGLARLGNEVTLAALDNVTAFLQKDLDRLRFAGVRVEHLDAHRWLGLRKLPRIRRWVKKHKFDVAISTGIRPDIVNAFLGDSVARVSSVRGQLGPVFRLRYGWIIGSIVASLNFWAIRRCDAAIALSRAMSDYLVDRRVSPHRITLIDNFLGEEWTSGLLPSSARALKNGPLRIGCFGSLEPNKRVDWVLSAVAQLQERDPRRPARLDIAGDGPLRGKLEKQAQGLDLVDVATFHGQVADVRPLMQQCDIVVLASITEGVPRSIMEAMALGKTCVASAVGGVPEMMKDGETGYLFESDSFTALVHALSRAAGPGGTLDPRVVSSHARRRFGLEKAAKRTLRLLEDLVSPREGTAEAVE